MGVSRRSILRGVSLGAGGALLFPMIHRVRAETAGTIKPMRFVFIVEGNGCNAEQVQPQGIERNVKSQNRNDLTDVVEHRLIDHDPAPALEPLRRYRDRMCILQGLSGRICGGGHSNDFGALGAYPAKSGAYAETVDWALAKKIGGIFPHVGLGITDKAEHAAVYNISASGPGKKLPTQCRPDQAYANLFGSVAGGDARQEFIAQGNLLDFMVEDVKRAEAQVSGTEREKLQSYVDSFESMRGRRFDLDRIADKLRAAKPEVTDKYRSPVETDRLESQFDLAAATLIGGLSNVVTIASGCGTPYFSVKFTGLGIAVGKHTIGHGGSYKDWTWSDMAIMIRRFHMQQIARLADQLDAIPEGDGTMLDHTLIIYMSDAAEAHHSRCWEWPVVMLGDLGGRLRTRGRFLQFPGYGNKSHRTIANLYTTLLNAAGDRRERFGLPDLGLADLPQDGPLHELLA
ncbi:MAG: DUF1552 domain-containing protein [Phycisphaera sp.]|nr:DUF1552 domain-containing protein [Phycisphaera sp.]